MKYALVKREYLPWNRADESWTRRKEIILSDSYEELSKIVSDNKMTVGNEVGEVKIIERYKI